MTLRRSVSAGSLGFGGLKECAKVVLSVEVREQAFSERPLPQLRDADAPWGVGLGSPRPAVAGHAYAWILD